MTNTLVATPDPDPEPSRRPVSWSASTQNSSTTMTSSVSLFGTGIPETWTTTDGRWTR